MKDNFCTTTFFSLKALLSKVERNRSFEGLINLSEG